MDRLQNLWVGTVNGLSIRQRRAVDKFVTMMSGKPQSITSNIILCMYEDLNGRIWAGTNGGGINIIDQIIGDPDFVAEGWFTQWYHCCHSAG